MKLFVNSSFLIILIIMSAQGAITTKPPLIAFGLREEHPYEYDMESDLASPQWELLQGPAGMVIDAEEGRIGWYPTMEQTGLNTISVTDGDETQTFEVYSHGLNQATRDFCATLNDAFDAAGSSEYYEYVNRQLVMYLGDSQSFAQLFGLRSAGDLGTSNVGAHNPRIYAFGLGRNDSNWVCSRGVNCSWPGSSSQPVDQNTCNSGQDGGLRSSGHGEFWGNKSSMKMSWGLANVASAWDNQCGGGAAISSIHYGHNDGDAGVSSSDYAADLRSVVDFFISKNTIPILITTPTTVEGGGWGSDNALGLFQEYADSAVAIADEYNIPALDLRRGVQTALNTVPGLTINDMLNDDVHYTFDLDNSGEWDNPLHNLRFAGNISAHLWNHMLGYLMDFEIKSRPPAWDKFTDDYRITDPTASLTYQFPATYDTSETTESTVCSILQDTYLENNYGPYGSNESMRLSNSPYQGMPCMDFDLSALPDNLVVDSAKVSLTVSSYHEGDQTQAVINSTSYLIPSNWDEDTYTISYTDSRNVTNEFTSGGASLSYTGPIAAGDILDFPVSKDIMDSYVGGSGNGIAISNDATSGYAHIFFSSKETSPVISPKLTVYYRQLIQASITDAGNVLGSDAVDLAVAPNPANPSTRISYTLGIDSRGKVLNIAIYDVKGNLIKTVSKSEAVPGQNSVQWNGTDSRGNFAASGVYIARLSVGGNIKTKKFTLFK
ncbi:MAG: DNRLRE domain-containing protein [Fibrobacterota bacterium]